MPAPILATKLHIPPSRHNLVPRPRLVEQLNEGMATGCRLTLISAPAGFGKTTLVSEWIAGCRRPAAWLSLEKEDNDLKRFWTYILAAIQTIQPDLGKAITELQFATPQLQTDVVLLQIINEIATISNPLLLILDDYHVIDSPAIQEGMTFLLEHIPIHLHLMIASRADPPWPLARWRTRGQLAEIRATDLRFTLEEATDFLKHTMTLDLSTQEITALEERTEGWIAGLQMAALSLQNRENVQDFIDTFTSSSRYIFDYLVEEVITRQPAEIQDFLLKTSILERLNSGLCEAVTGRKNCQEMLIQLEQRNLFLIPLDDDRQWYRYHHLFADLLINRLKKEHPEIVPLLHDKASCWYREKTLINPAILHALKANNLDLAEGLVKTEIIALGFHGNLSELVELIADLPKSLPRTHPWISIAYVWALKEAGKLDEAENYLKEFEDVFGEEKRLEKPEISDDERRHIRGYMAAIRSYLSMPAENWDTAITWAREALKLLPPEDMQIRAFMTSWLAWLNTNPKDVKTTSQAFTDAIILSKKAGDIPSTIYLISQLGGSQYLNAQLKQSVNTCLEAIRLAEENTQQTGYTTLAVRDAYLYASRAYYELNDLSAAEKAIRKGLKLGENTGLGEGGGFDHLLLARVLLAKGNQKAAIDQIERARQEGQHFSTRFSSYKAAWEALIHLHRKDINAAARWSQESGLRADDEVSLSTYVKHIVLARILVVQGRDETAGKGIDRILKETAGLLDRLLALAESMGKRKYIIETRAIQALALDALGSTEQAMATLDIALKLAEPEGFVRTFVDEGEPMANLLKVAMGKGIGSEYIKSLLPAFHTPSVSDGSNMSLLSEPISDRELEVLRLLESSMNTPEMARGLYISVGTVRTHIKSIYRKLEVNRRTEAVQRARELGLI